MKVVFLDIDGVIQPYNNQFRFDHKLNETIDYLCEKYSDNIYRQIDIYDVCAAYYDWDEIAIAIIKKILNPQYYTIIPEDSKVMVKEICNISRFSFLKRGSIVGIQISPFFGDFGQVFVNSPKFKTKG